MKIRTDFVTNSSSSSFIRLLVTTKDGKKLEGGYENHNGHVLCNEHLNLSSDLYLSEIEDMKMLVREARSWYADGLLHRSEMRDAEYGYGDLSKIKKLDKGDVQQITILWGVQGDGEFFEHEKKITVNRQGEFCDSHKIGKKQTQPEEPKHALTMDELRKMDHFSYDMVGSISADFYRDVIIDDVLKPLPDKTIQVGDFTVDFEYNDMLEHLIKIESSSEKYYDLGEFEKDEQFCLRQAIESTNLDYYSYHFTNILPLNKKQKRHRIAFFLKICQLCTTDEVLHRILMEFPKKKNGTLIKNRKLEIALLPFKKESFYDVTLRAVCRDDDRRIVIYIKEDTPLGLIENTLYDLNVWRNIIENGNIKKEQDLIERTSLFTRL